MDSFKSRVANVQKSLKAPKNQYNSFGKYKYRSCEDILEAAKPLCCENNILLTVSDEVVFMGNRFYIKSTAVLHDIESDSVIENSAYAREADDKKGMDDSQITGTASSYARKYALNGLFCIDDTKDADTDEYHNQTEKALVREIKELLAVKEMTIEDFEKTAKDKLENLSVERLEKGLEWLKKQ